MSYVNFLGEGVYGKQADFRRDAYPKDKIEATGTSHQYLGATAVSPIGTGNTKEAVIDQAVKVTTVADHVREEAKDLWGGLKDACFGTFTGTLIVGIAAGVASVLTGCLLPPLWPVAVAVGIVALAILGFSIWNVCRAVEAKEELSQWSDPLPGYQQERVLVGQKGVYHAYKNNFKGKFVSEEELKALWFTTMDRWVDRYAAHIPQDSVRLFDIRTFMEECPLKGQVMDYTFTLPSGVEEEEMELLRELSKKYQALKGGYDSVRLQTEALKTKIRTEQSSKLLQNDQWLHASLAPYEALLYAQKMALIAQKTKYNQVIIAYESSRPVYSHQHFHPHAGGVQTVGGHVIVGQGHRSHLPHGHLALTHDLNPIVPLHVVQARSGLLEINAKLAKMDLVFAAMTAPIRSVHAQNKAKVNAWANGELAKIQASEDQTLLKFYPPIEALLDAYKNRKSKEGAAEEIEAEVEIPVNPEAPEIRDEYEVAAFDPSWSEFIYEVDWDQKITKQTEIKHKGNTTTNTTTKKFH